MISFFLLTRLALFAGAMAKRTGKAGNKPRKGGISLRSTFSKKSSFFLGR